MKHCCDDKAEALAKLCSKQERVLEIVLALNAAMFIVELATGLVSRSTALLGDSLDMLGDAMVYGATLYASAGGPLEKARVALLKGGLMALFAAGVFVEASLRAVRGVVPDEAVMGGIGVLALAANLACIVLLLRHRDDDINMQSAWICSRNDVIANGAVIAAALAVGWLGASWPDIVVGAGIAALFAVSAIGVMKEASRALRAAARDRNTNAG